MTIFISNDDISPTSPWSVLWSDDETCENLDEFSVNQLGLSTSMCQIRVHSPWFPIGGQELYHYKLLRPLREQAIECGAVVTDLKAWMKAEIDRENQEMQGKD